MRVAFFGFTLNVAGSGTRQYVGGLARSFVQRGHQVSIISSRGDQKTSVVPGARYIDLADRRWPGPLGLAAFLATTFAHFARRSRDYDIIHCVSGYHSFALVTQLVRRLARAPVVHTVLAECDHPWLFRGISPLICVSELTRRKFASLQAVLIPTAIDPSRFRPVARPEGEPFTIGTMGSAAKRRGIRYFVEAIPELAERFPRTRFRLAIDLNQPGVAGERQILEELAWIRSFLSRPSLQGRVDILGEVDVPEFLSSLDAFVYPVQTTRGMVDLPPTVLECLAAGVPLVTTREGGIPEALVHQRHALLVEREHKAEPAHYAQAVARLLEDAALRESLRQEGLRLAASYDIAVLAPRIENLYQETIVRNPHAKG